MNDEPAIPTRRDVELGWINFERETIKRRGLAEFIRRAWSVVEPDRLQYNWHIDAIAEHLTALFKREIRSLVINIPPGCSKSLICSVLFPAWVWTIDPGHRWLMLSYDKELAFRDARKMRTLVMSEWYQARWPEVEVPDDRTASTAVGLWFNTKGGMRSSGTLRGGVTGKHAHTAGIDDPIDTTGAGADSGKELDEVARFMHQTLPTRFVEPAESAQFTVMQRLHQRDPSAELIRNGATVLCLPMRFEKNHPQRWERDPRTEEGELLHPKRFPKEVVDKLEKDMNTFAFAAQEQQRPTPEGGGIYQKDWFKRWIELPTGGEFWISVDCKFKDTKDSGSYVAIGAWYHCGPNHYLVDQIRGRISFTETCEAFISMCARWPRAYGKLVEAKANGPAVVEMLESKISGLLLLEPEGGKIARANAVQPIVKAGNVFLPSTDPACPARYDDGRGPQKWVDEEFVDEVTAFPRGQADDQVDQMTQYLNHVAPKIDVADTWRKALAGYNG